MYHSTLGSRVIKKKEGYPSSDNSKYQHSDLPSDGDNRREARSLRSPHVRQPPCASVTMSTFLAVNFHLRFCPGRWNRRLTPSFKRSTCPVRLMSVGSCMHSKLTRAPVLCVHCISQTPTKHATPRTLQSVQGYLAHKKRF